MLHKIPECNKKNQKIKIELLKIFLKIIMEHYGSFKPKLNLQPTGFRLASN